MGFGDATLTPKPLKLAELVARPPDHNTTGFQDLPASKPVDLALRRKRFNWDPEWALVPFFFLGGGGGFELRDSPLRTKKCALSIPRLLLGLEDSGFYLGYAGFRVGASGILGLGFIGFGI